MWRRRIRRRTIPRASRTKAGRTTRSRRAPTSPGRPKRPMKGRLSCSTQVRQYSFRLVRPRHNHDSRAGPELVLVNELGRQRCQDFPMVSPAMGAQVSSALDLMTPGARQV